VSRWLVKTEPSEYSFARLQEDGTTVWSGVMNPAALRNIRAMKKGDEVIVYHTGDERAAVGLAKVASDPYAEPKRPNLPVADLAAVRPLKKPVTLATVKSMPFFADFVLVRQGRLSVMPVTDGQWAELMRLAGEITE
jgi:predicted RNA-binding protein with PUA-like domain